ncbi:MAG TPA: hypothetical protein V6C99_00650 [Oculatellaceae cyanobacterium]
MTVAYKTDLDPQQQRRLEALLPRAPWLLRITEFKDKPAPVLVIKERITNDNDVKLPKKGSLRERGLIYGQALQRCLPVIRLIVAGVVDDAGVPLELQRFFMKGRISFRGSLPLDEQAGAKLSLIFKLQERVTDLDRVELMAWRVLRFTKEEAVYWLTRATQYGKAANRWAWAGMRLMLGGQPGDPAIKEMLEQLRR